MGFYTVLYRVNSLIEQRGWKLNHCRRCGRGVLRYYITDPCGTVLAPVIGSGRSGLTLAQLLQWLARQEDAELAAFATRCQTLEPLSEIPSFEAVPVEVPQPIPHAPAA